MNILKHIALGAFLLAMISCAEPNEDATGVTITATGIEDGSIEVLLAASETDSAFATGKLVNGEAQIDFDLDYPQMIGIRFDGVQTPVIFYADQTAMTVDVDGNQMPPSFTITGSTYNDSLEAFGQNQQSNEMFVQGFAQEWQRATEANDSLTMFVIQTKADSAYKAFDRYKLAFAQRNGLLGAMIAQRFIYDASYGELQPIYDNILVEHRHAPDVIAFKERLDILKNTQVGMRFTDITEADTSGVPFSISSIEGEYILIDFWASWCGPCRRANPELVEIHRDFKDKGFQIVGVSLDKEEKAWKKAIQDDNLNWPQMSNLKGWGSQAAASYAIRSIPQSIIIDHQGFIVNKNLEPKLLRAFLEDKLN